MAEESEQSGAPGQRARQRAGQGAGPGAGPAAEQHFLDGPGARLLALGVILLAALALAWMHRDDLFPPEAAAPAADDPIALCFAARAAEIDQMVTDKVVTLEQANLFKNRAEALCAAQHGAGSGPPPPPQ